MNHGMDEAAMSSSDITRSVAVHYKSLKKDVCMSQDKIDIKDVTPKPLTRKPTKGKGIVSTQVIESMFEKVKAPFRNSVATAVGFIVAVCIGTMDSLRRAPSHFAGHR